MAHHRTHISRAHLTPDTLSAGLTATHNDRRTHATTPTPHLEGNHATPNRGCADIDGARARLHTHHTRSRSASESEDDTIPTADVPCPCQLCHHSRARCCVRSSSARGRCANRGPPAHRSTFCTYPPIEPPQTLGMGAGTARRRAPPTTSSYARAPTPMRLMRRTIDGASPCGRPCWNVVQNALAWCASPQR